MAKRASVARSVPAPAVARVSAVDVQATRALFWHHIVREMLTTLAVMQESQPQMFDGRLAVLTHAGERIPLAEVTPLFACGVPGTPAQQALSMAVECTIFRIRTPDGEVFTLPVHEIRAMHSLTEELLKQLEQGAMDSLAGEPFGFAAFTSLARQQPAQAANSPSPSAAPTPTPPPSGPGSSPDPGIALPLRRHVVSPKTPHRLRRPTRPTRQRRRGR